MKIDMDVFMQSELVSGSGGRETWLSNFLTEIGKREGEFSFSFFCAESTKPCLVQAVKGWKGLVKHVWRVKITGALPSPVLYALNLLRLFREQSIQRSPVVICVGGLNEIIPVLILYNRFKYNGLRVAWLRTVYTLEKGYRLNPLSRWLIQRFESLVLNRMFDLVLANGHDTAEFYGRLGVECVVVPNGVEIQRWTGLAASPSNTMRIGYIGRLSGVKGIEEFLSAVRSVGITDRFSFHVAGGGDKAIESAVLELQSEGLLRYHGELTNEQVPALMKELDCCVALTHLGADIGGGGVSNALVEQMSSGKLIIAWDNLIYRRVLDSDSALFVRQGDVEDLVRAFHSAALGVVFHEETIRRSTALACNYSIANHVDKFLAAIEAARAAAQVTGGGRAHV